MKKLADLSMFDSLCGQTGTSSDVAVFNMDLSNCKNEADIKDTFAEELVNFSGIDDSVLRDFVQTGQMADEISEWLWEDVDNNLIYDEDVFATLGALGGADKELYAQAASLLMDCLNDDDFSEYVAAYMDDDDDDDDWE